MKDTRPPTTIVSVSCSDCGGVSALPLSELQEPVPCWAERFDHDEQSLKKCKGFLSEIKS